MVAEQSQERGNCCSSGGCETNEHSWRLDIKKKREAGVEGDTRGAGKRKLREKWE